jgi:hypothetical protein
MPNTTNFNWPTPADTDLVKDGAAAIRNLGDGVDTSLVDLKGGTTGQILSKASNADMDFTFVTPNVGDLTEVQAGTGISVADGTGPIPVVTNTVATAFDAKGDLVVGTGADTFAKLTVGTNGHTLVADSVETTGLKWVAPAGGGSLTFISRTTFSNVSSQAFDNVFSSTYKGYYAQIEDISAATTTDDFQLQFRYAGPTTQTSSYYGTSVFANNSSGTVTNNNINNLNQGTISPDTRRGAGYIWFYGVGVTATEMPAAFFNYYNRINSQQSNGVVQTDVERNYTGFLLKSASTNISGTVALYGIAN